MLASSRAKNVRAALAFSEATVLILEIGDAMFATSNDVAEPGETDINEEEGGGFHEEEGEGFHEEELAEDSEAGNFGGDSEDLDSVVSVGGKEPIPIRVMQEEPSINDSVSSTTIDFDITMKIYLLRLLNRMIERSKAAVKMKGV